MAHISEAVVNVLRVRADRIKLAKDQAVSYARLSFDLTNKAIAAANEAQQVMERSVPNMEALSYLQPKIGHGTGSEQTFNDEEFEVSYNNGVWEQTIKDSPVIPFINENHEYSDVIRDLAPGNEDFSNNRNNVGIRDYYVPFTGDALVASYGRMLDNLRGYLQKSVQEIFSDDDGITHISEGKGFIYARYPESSGYHHKYTPAERPHQFAAYVQVIHNIIALHHGDAIQTVHAEGSVSALYLEKVREASTSNVPRFKTDYFTVKINKEKVALDFHNQKDANLLTRLAEGYEDASYELVAEGETVSLKADWTSA